MKYRLVSPGRAVLAAIVCGVLGSQAAGSAVQAIPPSAPSPKPLHAQAEPAGRAGGNIKGHAPAVAEYKSIKVAAAAWPKPATAQVNPVSSLVAAAPQRAGALPVWLAGNQEAVGVQVLDRATAPAGQCWSGNRQRRTRC